MVFEEQQLKSETNNLPTNSWLEERATQNYKSYSSDVNLRVTYYHCSSNEPVGDMMVPKEIRRKILGVMTSSSF